MVPGLCRRSAILAKLLFPHLGDWFVWQVWGAFSRPGYPSHLGAARSPSIPGTVSSQHSLSQGRKGVIHEFQCANSDMSDKEIGFSSSIVALVDGQCFLNAVLVLASLMFVRYRISPSVGWKWCLECFNLEEDRRKIFFPVPNQGLYRPLQSVLLPGSPRDMRTQL